MRLTARGAIAILSLLLLTFPARAGDVPDYEGEFFTDLTHQVPTRTAVDISRRLRVAAQSNAIHPMLVVIDRMSSYPALPQDEKGFATRLANDWNIGDVTTKKGVLALFALGDHKFYVAKTTNVDQSVTDAITQGFSHGTTEALKKGDVPQAMTRAADAIATALATLRNNQPVVQQPVTQPGTTGSHTVTRTTHTHRVDGSPFSYSYSGGSSGGGSFLCLLVGLFVIVVFLLSIMRSAFGGGGGYGRGYYGGYYGGGSGGGGFLSGMFTGGLLGYMFGNSGSYYPGYGGYGGWGSSGWSSGPSYTDTTTTETWSSSGSDSSWSSGGSSFDSGSSGGGFDSFGGGSFDGGGSGGSW